MARVRKTVAVPTSTDPEDTIARRAAVGNFDPEVGDDAAMQAMQPSASSDDLDFPPFGLTKVGRVQANAGQEGAQAVYEYRAHHTGRSEDADEGPDYGAAYQRRTPQVDET